MVSMMSRVELGYHNRRIAEEAAQQQKKPYVPFDLMEINDFKFTLPMLGSHDPEGWTELEDRRMFVGYTGGGLPSEPALTIRQFKIELQTLYLEALELGETWGFAIVDQGPFQVHVGVFRKEESVVQGDGDRQEDE